MKEEAELAKVTQFIREFFAELGGDPNAPFKPGAYHDEPLDAIRVTIEDCSVTEVPFGSWLVLHERNYFDPEKIQKTHVGFSIEGARHFCKTHDLPIHGTVKILDIIESILTEEKNHRARAAFNQVVLPILEDYKIEVVEFPPA